MSTRLSPFPTLWAIVALAAILRVWPFWFGLPYQQARPDEAVAIAHAMDVLGGDLNPRFFHWPSLTFYVFAALFGVVSAVRRLFTGDAAVSYATAAMAARLLVAVAGTATVYVLFVVGRRTLDAATGLLAALFLAVAILHVRDSHFAMTDVLMTLLVTSSLALLIRALDRAQPPRTTASDAAAFGLSGFLGGLAASTKYNAAAVLAAMAAAQIVLLLERRKRLRIDVLVPGAAFACALVIGFLAGTPYAVLDFERFSGDLRYDFTHLSTGHGINLGRGWIYHLTRSLPYGVGPLVFAAAVPGSVFLARRAPRAAIVIGAFAAAFYAGIGSGYTVFFRYVLPLVPIICLLAAAGVSGLASSLARYTGRSEVAAAWVLAAVLAGPALANCVWFDVLLGRTDTRVVAGEWLAAHVNPGDTIHDAGGDYARLDLGRARVHQWPFDRASASFGNDEGRMPDWIVLTQSPIRTYASAPAVLRRIAADRYDLVFSVTGTKGAAGAAVYDLQDAFFMPVSGFSTVERPGPTILIYRRRNGTTAAYLPASIESGTPTIENGRTGSLLVRLLNCVFTTRS